MSMVEVVRIGKSTIELRDDIANRCIAVCIRCKGFKKLYKTDYHENDPCFWIGHAVVCPMCNGAGLYMEDKRTPA